jgi:glutamate racemase
MTQPSIGVFDSGVGGLSVLREIRRRLPNAPLVYFADQAHVPYGSRSLEEVKSLSEGITGFLLEQGSEVIVVACNTASAAALHSLRSTFQGTPFVGMEPAVKPAAERTETRKVAVLATPATFQGALFESVVERFAKGVEVIEIVAPGLVELIESGHARSDQVSDILQDPLSPAANQGIDTVVLACTHYSFVIPALKQLLGPSVNIIDPAPAVARKAERLWTGAKENTSVNKSINGDLGIVSVPVTEDRELPDSQLAVTAHQLSRYVTSGEPLALRSLIFDLIGDEGDPEVASWETGSLKILQG